MSCPDEGPVLLGTETRPRQQSQAVQGGHPLVYLYSKWTPQDRGTVEVVGAENREVGMPVGILERLGPVGPMGLQDLKEQKVGALLPPENAHGRGLYSVGARAQAPPLPSLTPSSASSPLCKGLKSRLSEKVSTERSSYHLVHRWSSGNADGWFCRAGSGSRMGYGHQDVCCAHFWVTASSGCPFSFLCGEPTTLKVLAPWGWGWDSESHSLRVCSVRSF